MNNFSKQFIDDDGKEKVLVADSSDDYEVNLDKPYTFANHKVKKQSKITKKFQNSILGTDIGIKSGGFSNVAILAIIIAIAVFAVLFFIWKI